MLHKYSELDIYEDFINGNLEPRKLQGSYLQALPKYLKEELEECHDMILGKFKKQGRKKLLIEKIKISSAHPLADEYFNDDLQLFDNQSLIPKDVFEQLDINGELTSEQVVLKKQDNYSIIGVTIESEWEELESDRLKYCYINLLLQEHIRKIKIRLRNDFFSHDKEKAKIIVANVQSILNSYLNDVLNQYQLTETDLEIKVKANYTNKDCAALIYLSIIDLHNFIYAHFYELLDKKQKVPFYASVVNENSFVASAKKILKLLKDIDMDPALYSYIEFTLEKVLKINTGYRITYLELSYFKQFLKNFSRYLYKNKFHPVSESQIINFLLAHNFNDYLFCEHLEELYKNELLDYNDAVNMKVYLTRKKTEIQQINIFTKEKLIPDGNDIIKIILKWIDCELEYVKSLETVPKNSSVQLNHQIQLNTNMKVSELAFLFKFLHDKKKVQPTSIVELAKWIRNSFQTDRNTSFSIQNIKNNMYNPTEKTLEAMKELGIDLFNEVKNK